MTRTLNIAGRLHTIADDGVLISSDELLDERKNKKQNVVNADVDSALADRYTKSEVYTKQEVNNLVSPNQNYVTVAEFTDLPISGATDTIYRVSSWDGSLSTPAVDVTKYSEYAWDDTGYVFLCVKTQIGEVYDISAANSGAKYADLSAALGVDGGNVPSEIRRGGMSVKFVQSSYNKYVQYRLMTSEWSLIEIDWQGVDDEPTAGSDNLVKSGGVADKLVELEKKVNGIKDKTKFVDGRINAQGNIEGGSDFVCAHKLPLEDTPIILFNVAHNPTYNYYGVVLYDESQQLSSILTLSSGLHKTVILDSSNIPSNARYYSVTCLKREDYGIGMPVSDYLANGYVYRGVASVNTTPINKVNSFYIATKKGDYSNFGVVIPSDGLYIIKTSNSTWSIESLTNNIVSDFIKNNNISCIGGYTDRRISSNGSLESLAGQNCAALYKYPISDLSFPLLICGIQDNQAYGFYGVTYYDEDENVVSQPSFATKDIIVEKVDVPTNAKYISVTFDTRLNFGISSQHTLDKYVPLNKDLFNNVDKRIDSDGNLFDGEGYVSAYKVPISNFEFPIYIYGVTENTQYNVHGITFYRADGVKLSTANIDGRVVKDIIPLTKQTIPSNTAYFSVTSHKKLNCGIDSMKISDYLSKQNNNTTKSVWSGKSICVIGDSLTENGGWEPMLKDMLSLSHCYNRGIAGSKLRDVAAPDNILLYTDRNNQEEKIVKQHIANDSDIPSPIPSNCVLLRKNETGMCNAKRLQYMVDATPNVDAYIIWGGVNDWVMPEGITTWSQVYNKIENKNYDLTKLEDAYIYLIKYLRKKNYNARIFCVGVPRATGYIDQGINVGGRSGSDFLFAINESLEKVSKLLSVPFLNLLDVTPISLENSYHYTDGLHPTTEVGYRMYANNIANFLNNNYPIL